MSTATDLLHAYLEDAIAAEKNFETQLRAFAKEGDDAVAIGLFSQHADETRIQYDRLQARLNLLGGSTSGLKTMLAHMLGMLPSIGKVGHHMEERTVQNLIIAYTVECAETAMYEALAIIAKQAGDTETEALAREIQQEERTTADKLWAHLPTATRVSFNRIVGTDAPTYRKAG
jgi:ferritin-like metal-binding protein YciE